MMHLLTLVYRHRVLDVHWRGHWVLRVTPHYVIRFLADGVYSACKWR